ncbi:MULTISPECIES: type VII secretion-associated serine protease mycosin [Kitasatospora]|uniref:type VII secretion-associated serine protease mycosin n=1 Tax=Kitasatospora TaxID=2063 RepID=UPI0031E2B623
MTTNRSVRGVTVLATGALLWSFCAAPASADAVRDSQWPLQNYGAADRVWPVSQGEGVIVAVIDSGVSDHQDLSGQVLPGADFSGGMSDGRKDTVGHGTSMAGLIAGHGHGGQAGVMGLAPKAKILPVKVDLGDGKGNQDALDNMTTHTDVADAVRFAVDHGAKVISMSIGGETGDDTAAREAIRYAVDKDVVLVSATGNKGDTGHPVQYPAAFPGVVAVGAVDRQGHVWNMSDKGPETTLVAPGVDITDATATSSSSYGKGSGTSSSTAYVSAIAALIRSKFPNLSAGQVINRMIKSAVAPPDKSTVPNDSYGYGIASAAGALAPNPTVDNGPKENPLLHRVESHKPAGVDDSEPSASPSAAASPAGSGTGGAGTAAKNSSRGPLLALGGGIAVLVVVVVVVLVIRRARRSGGGSGGPGAPGAGAGPADYMTPAPQPPFGGAAQQPPFGAPVPQQGYAPAYPPQQPPAGPPAGNPYQS